jgi:hypothetical protein
MKLNINTDAVVKFTAKLEQISRSALPNAIRNALNKAAFDVKQRTMPKEADKTFTKRQPNFFKANSRVTMAKGFDIGSMESVVGFTSANLKGGNNHAVKELEQQERGGTIQKRSFIPMDAARTSPSKPVRPANRLSGIKGIINADKAPGKTVRQKFINAVRKAGPGGYVLGNLGKKKLYKIQSISKIAGRTVIKKRALYTYEEGRDVNVKGTGFMQAATIESANDIEKFYIAEAKRQIARIK